MIFSEPIFSILLNEKIVILVYECTISWMLMLLNTLLGEKCRIGRRPRCTLLRAAARRSATSSAASDEKKKEERILCSRYCSLADNVITFTPAFV